MHASKSNAIAFISCLEILWSYDSKQFWLDLNDDGSMIQEDFIVFSKVTCHLSRVALI